MANTEIRNALQYVRKAENAVSDALDNDKLSDSDEKLLVKASRSLDDLDNLLVSMDISEDIGDLKKALKKLQGINTQVQEEVSEMKAVAQTVGDVADTVGALVDAFQILSTAGLI